MTLARVRVREVAIPLVRPLATAHGEIRQRSGWLVELEDDAGFAGAGEALPLPEFAGESSDECARALCTAAPLLLSAFDPEAGLPSAIDVATAAAPIARAALETALLDCSARRGSRSLAQLLGAQRPPPSLPVNALLAARTPRELENEAAAAVAAGYGTLKLKLGAQSLEADLECVRAVARAVPATARIRLDANGAWSESEALDALRKLSRLRLASVASIDPMDAMDASPPIEWVEQPIAPGDPRALARLRAASGVRIAADESVSSLQAVRALLAADAVDALVIKLPTLGGPRAAHAAARLAQEAGVRVAVTSFLDSTLGIAAAAQLAAALAQPLPACGLATSPLLADDLAEPWRIERGQLWLPEADSHGIGCEARGARLDRLVGKTLVEAGV